MPQRSEIKKRAKEHLKRNYWVMIFVSLVMLLCANAYKDSNEDYFFVSNDGAYGSILDSNFEVTNDVLNSIFKTDNIEEIESFENVTGGTFRVVFNIFTKFERVLFRITRSILNIFDPARAGIVIGIIIYFLQLLYKVFIAEPLLIGEGRFYLESRLYSKTKFNRIFYCFKRKKYLKAVRASFRKSLYLFLWSLTIIGVIIKTYSYRMVSYIMAEKPDLNSKEAILLSRKMMYGHKWDAFILDLSFIGWRILDVLTFGVFGVVFTNPYYRATDIEFYTEIKNNNNDIELDDKLLENPDCLISYPGIKARKKFDASEKFNYYKRYSLSSFILFFFSFSIVGFIWEVIVHFVQYGEFVKRGTLMGPWIPIYGFGCVIVLLLLVPKKFKKITDNPMVTFLLIMLICSVMEYGTSVFLEATKGMRWWDYTGFFMNLNGRICLEGSLFFGLGGSICIYVIAPFLDTLFSKINKNIRNILCVVLVIFFSFDFIYAQFNPNVTSAAPVDKETGELIR